MSKLEQLNEQIQNYHKSKKIGFLKNLVLGICLRYNVYKLKLKVMVVNKRLNKTKGDNMNLTVDRLTQIKSDIVNSLDADKSCCLLITVPDIGIRDYFLSDPLFSNFYSNRVSFREKKNKNNKFMLIGIETL